MTSWTEVAARTVDDEAEPRSAIMVWVDKNDPDCGLGFVRFVVKEDRSRMIELLGRELELLKARHAVDAEGDDELHKRIMEELDQ